MPPSNKPSIPRVYSAYDPPPRVRLDCSAEPVLTQQNFRDECDINNIIARFKDNGFADVPQADASNRFSMSRRLLIFTRLKISSKMPRQFFGASGCCSEAFSWFSFRVPFVC